MIAPRIVRRPAGPETNPHSFNVEAVDGSGVVGARIDVKRGKVFHITSAGARKMAFLLNFAADKADNKIFGLAPDGSMYTLRDDPTEAK